MGNRRFGGKKTRLCDRSSSRIGMTGKRKKGGDYLTLGFERKKGRGAERKESSRPGWSLLFFGGRKKRGGEESGCLLKPSGRGGY